MSIGYQIIKEYYKDNIKHIYELKLWEISFVTFPSNENARIHSVKSSKLMHIESKLLSLTNSIQSKINEIGG